MDLPLVDFGVALAIGALVGIDREKSKAAPNGDGIAGLRTFILMAEAGAVSAWLSVQLQTPAIFAMAGAVVAAMVVVGHFSHARVRPESYGLTTEVATLVVFLLGGTVLFGYRDLAVAMAVVTSAVLAYKHPLHGLVAKLSQEDLYAGLKLLIATFIVLKVLPNRTLDPWGAINPYKMWWLVILISGLSLVGYVASRCLGSDRGTPLTGLVGGLVSSTAVTLSFARRSSEDRNAKGLAGALVAGILLSWVVMFVRIVVAVVLVNPEMLGPILVPMATMGTVATVAAILAFLRARKASSEVTSTVPLTNPFSLTSAVKFACLFTVVMLAVKIVQEYLPGRGFYVVAALAGLTDADAIALSMAEYAKSGDLAIAAVSIAIAAMSNTLSKCGLVLWLGAKELRTRVLVASAAIVVAGLISLAAMAQ
jgi:uncharacterized membrane protein (DUF4010 family)